MASTAVVPQHMRALGRANEVRVRRAELKRQITYGEVDVNDVLMDPPDWALTMKVGELLCALERFGPYRVRQVLLKDRDHRPICRPDLQLEVLGEVTRARICERVDDALGRLPE